MVVAVSVRYLGVGIFSHSQLLIPLCGRMDMEVIESLIFDEVPVLVTLPVTTPQPEYPVGLRHVHGQYH